jgi:hypothetical protein
MSILLMRRGGVVSGGGGGGSFDPYGNRPSGYTNVESDYGFTAVVPANTGDTSFGDGSGWFSVFNSAGFCTRGSDATAPISPSNVLEWNYAEGEGSPSESAGFGQVFRRPGAGKSAWYISFAVYHDSNFEFNAVSNKLLGIWPTSSGAQLLESKHFASPGDILAWQFEAPESVTTNGDVAYYPANTTFGEALTDAFLKGNWVNIEVQYIPSTGTGGTNGTLRTWAGRCDGSDGAVGQLVSEYTGINCPQLASDNELQLNSTWGGGSGPTTRSSTRRVDHFYASYP